MKYHSETIFLLNIIDYEHITQVAIIRSFE